MSKVPQPPKRPSEPAAFWISFALTLAVILPLLGCLVLYSGWLDKQQARAAQREEAGVPIVGPGPEQDITVLVVVAREKPGFVLLRLDAPNAVLHICPLPGESVLRSPGGPVLLEDSYQSAGPGRAAALVSETLNITIDRYLAITPESIGKIWGELEPPRVNLENLLSAQELGGLGLKDDPVIWLRPQDAGAFLDRVAPGPARRARLEGAVWEAALRQQLDELPKAAANGLRKESSSILGNLDATDFFKLEKSLDWLARQETRVESELLPGHYNRQTDRYEFDAESVAFMKERFAKPLERLEQPLQPSPAPATPDEE